jgi:LacI family transcriptional regulator
MANITIKDIARASGYSIKTVSRVVNHAPTVTPEIRDKIEAVIARFDYQPNVWARSLRSSRSQLIALFSDDPTFDYFSKLQLAATIVCQQAGYHLMLEMSPNSKSNLVQAVKNLANSTKLDGVLVIPPESDNLSFMKALVAAKLPFVRVTPNKHFELSSYVQIDDRQVAYDIVRYLIELGHRQIAYIAGPRWHSTSQLRLAGFRAAMKDHELAVCDDWVITGGYDVQSGMQSGQVLFSGRRRPTAVAAYNDATAIGVMASAYAQGMAIPRDVSVVGIDDSPIASTFWPKLTTVRQPVAELGQAATEILIREIEGGTDRVVRKLECEIVVRDSSGPPRMPKRKRAVGK